MEMKNKGLIKYLGIILIGSILLSCGMRVWAEEGEKESEKVEIEVREDEYGTTKKKYLVTKEERDRIFRMRDAVNETLGAIEEAYRNREIDLDTKLICKVKALEEPGSVPEKYKSIKYGKEKPELKYHQDGLKRVLREVHKKWLETRIETHSKIWSSEIFPYLKKYIEKKTEREREIFGYESLYISPTDAYVIRDAYLIREIDLDQMMLYIYGPPEETPAKFLSSKPTKIPKPIPRDIIMPTPWDRMLPLVRYSRYLKPETKEKIKLHRWKDLAERQRNMLGIGIDSPKEAVKTPGKYYSWIFITNAENLGGLKTYTPTAKIKGKIETPEMYPEVEAWVVVAPDGGLSFPVDESRQLKEIKKEIILGPPRYQKPEFDEKAFKEEYEKWTEVEVDEFAMEYERGPGKIIRPFEVELELPYYLANIITIGARNNGDQSTSVGLYVTRYDSTDKEPPKVEIKDPKKGESIGIKGEYETVTVSVSKDGVVRQETRQRRREIGIFCEAKDDKRLLWVEVYANGEFAGRDSQTDKYFERYDENGKSIYADYYRVDVPAKIGESDIRVIAYDIGGNKATDRVKVRMVLESE
jgi:hypothetical protein